MKKNKTLDKLKAKRAKYAAGGYGYTDVSDVFVTPTITQPTASSSAQQKAISTGSVTRTGPTTETEAVQGEGFPESPLYGAPRPVPANPDYPTKAESAALRQWNTANGFDLDAGSGSIPSPTVPTDIKITGPQANIRQAKSVGIDPQEGITGRSAVQQLDGATDATSSTVTAGAMTAEQGGVKTAVEGPTTKDAKKYTAETAGSVGTTKAAKFDEEVTKATAGGTDGGAEASKALKTERDDAKETEAKGTAVKRDPNLIGKEYATAATDGVAEVVSGVEGPDVDTRTGVVIPQSKIDEIKLDAENRGFDPDQALEDYKNSREFREAQTGTAAEGTEAQLGVAPEEVEAVADYYAADFTEEASQTDIDNTPAYEKAATRKAQVGEAAQRIATELGDAPPIDLEGREAITGTAPQGTAAEIGGIPTAAAATMQAVKGEERKVAAADMMAVIANVQPEITAAIAEDPATVPVEEDKGADPQTIAAVAALPVEALVSTQMENLLAGMEGGKTPLWAKPAVDAMNQQMAARGLSVSTVGRDALFNAIIQSALPMAQSNAQALQQRAQQNLSNEQQANLSSAQGAMQIRMQNLANRQTAASQTAQMSQQIKVQQGTFNQQAVMTSADQRQQTELANAQMAQQRAQQESAQRQQAVISELDVNSRMDLANLQAESLRAGKDMDADQQMRLTKYNAQISKVMRQADLNQDMEKANLAPALQVEMQRVSEMNAASKDTMTAENQERLVQLQTLIDFRKTDAQFAQQMDMANMSNEQQMELAMLQDKAATDSANFTADNAFEMQQLNQKVARSVRQAELNARMKEVNLDASLKVELAELSEKNVTSRANMTADQQMRLANLNVLVDFKKSDAQFAQQMELANLGNEQQMELAMLQDRSATDAANFTEGNRSRTQELNTYVQVMSQNEQLRQNADMANLSMEEKIELANLSSKSQADMASMSAENIAELQVYEKKMAAGQVNAQLAQQMGLANLSNEQSAAMFNAQINANFDMSQMSNEQQMEMANSKFMQTMTATKFSADQQTAIQNATALTQVDLANADARTRVSVENAKNFLTMDMANLNNEQQGIVMDQQMAQQTLLSDQAAKNAALQFGATSQNQIDQFMISQSNNMKQFNTSARNAMESFNVTEANRTAAIEAGNTLQADSLTAQLEVDISKFNASIDNQRDQWNAANAQAVEQSNIQWRRQANTANTAAANAANQTNVQNAYNISALDQTQMWQTLRDEASYIRQAYENNEQREAQLIATAIGNESGAAKDTTTSTSSLLQLIRNYGGI